MWEQLSCIEQKPSEKSEQYANKIRHLIWKAKEVASTEDEDAEYATKLTEYLALNRFKNYSLPKISRFLQIKGVAIFHAAVQEAFEKQRPNETYLTKKKFCSRCQMTNHTRNECRKKIQNFTGICSYCNISDHSINECHKKYFNKKNKEASQHTTRTSQIQTLQVYYCKKRGHKEKLIPK